MPGCVAEVFVPIQERRNEYYAVGSSETLGPWPSLKALESNVPNGDWVVTMKLKKVTVTGA